MKILRWLMRIFYPVVWLMFFASLLTTMPYMSLSKGLYASHDDIEFDHDYVAKQLMDYLNYRHDDLTFGANEGDESVLMRDIEIRHMEDVKDVYTMLRVISTVGVVFVAAAGYFMYLKNRTYFYETVRNSFWLPLGFIAFVGTWFLIDFNRIFTWFHLLFFDNDDWILRHDDVLIQLLPQTFWLVSGVLIIVGTSFMIALTLYLNEKFIGKKGL